MGNRAGILAGEAYVQMDLDDEQYRVAMKLAMEQLRQFNRNASLVVRATTTMGNGLRVLETKVRGLGRALATVVGTVSKFSRLIFDTLAPAMFFLGAAAAGFGAAVLRAVEPAARAFANLEDVVSRFRITFGQAAPAAERWGRSFARAIGYADSTILDIMGRFQALLTTQGVPDQMAQVASSGLAQLVPNLASFFEQRPEEVITRLFSGLVGEMEAVRRLGIDLSAQAVDTQLKQFGVDPKTATQGQKALARYNIIVSQTKVAQQDLRLTSDSLANTVTRLNQSWVRTKEIIGGALAPALTSLSNILDQVLRKFQPFFESTQFKQLATTVVAASSALFVLGSASVALAPIVTAFGSMASFATALAGTITSGITVGLIGAVSAARLFTSALGASWNLLLRIGQAGALKGVLGRSLSNIANSLSTAARGTGGGFARQASAFVVPGPPSGSNSFAGTNLQAMVDASRAARATQNQSSRVALGWARLRAPVEKLDDATRYAATSVSKMATAVQKTTTAQRKAEQNFRNLSRSERFRLRQAGTGVSGVKQQILAVPAERAGLGPSVNAEIARRVELDRPRIGILEQLRRASFPEDALRSRVVASGATGQGPSLLARAFQRMQPALSGLSKIATSFANVLRAIGPAVLEIGKRFLYMTVVFKAIGAAVTPITKTISASFSNLVQQGKTLIGTLGAVGMVALDVGRDLFSAFGQIVNLLISGNVSGAADVASRAWEYLRAVTSSTMNSLTEAFGGFFGAVGDSISELIKGAQYLAYILANPGKAIAAGQSIRSAETQISVEKMREAIENSLRAGGLIGRGESVASGTSFTRDGELRNVTIEDASGRRTRAIKITEAEFQAAEEAGKALAKEFALNLAKGARDRALADSGLNIGIGNVGEGVAEAFGRVAKEILEDPAVVQARANLAAAIAKSNEEFIPNKTNIPGANPQQVAIPALGAAADQAVKSISNVGAAIKRIAQTTGLGDASGRGRFLSRDSLAQQLAQQQLDVLKKIERNTDRPPLNINGVTL